MCVFNIGMLLGDLTNWFCEGLSNPLFPFLLKAGTVIYYSCSAFLLLAFAGYIIEYINIKIKVKRGFWNIAFILAAFQLAGSLLSLWNGAFFRITETNIYQRGSWFFLSQLIPFGIFVINTLLILSHRRVLSGKEQVFLLSHVVLPLIAELIQIINYGIALLNVGTTISLLLVFINIQLERELLLQRQEKELAESRIDIMLSQIQPHFLYNTLATIHQLCGIDPVQAKKAVLDFSQFLRVNMDFLTNKVPIPFLQELKHVKTYLNLEQLRFQERLQVEYQIQAEDFFLPSLTLQPIVENAVRHGIATREEGGRIILSTREGDGCFTLSVQDNGVGFPSADSAQKDGAHIGIANVRIRLWELCSGTLQIQAAPDAGTIVTITIPKEGQ